MTSKTIVITGASDGIGAAAARALHRKGHQVVVVGRSPEKTRAVAQELGVESYVADFTDLDAVRALAQQLRTAFPRIDVLANNTGGVFGDRRKTVDGHEKTLQVNISLPSCSPTCCSTSSPPAGRPSSRPRASRRGSTGSSTSPIWRTTTGSLRPRRTGTPSSRTSSSPASCTLDAVPEDSTQSLSTPGSSLRASRRRRTARP